MICKCCMDCHKIDSCDGRCNFNCSEYSYNNDRKKRYESEKIYQNPTNITTTEKYEDELNSRKIEYRKKHKSCFHCAFMEHFSRPGISIEYEKCNIKDKIIKNNRFNALFCKYYKPK